MSAVTVSGVKICSEVVLQATTITFNSGSTLLLAPSAGEGWRASDNPHDNSQRDRHQRPRDDNLHLRRGAGAGLRPWDSQTAPGGDGAGRRRRLLALRNGQLPASRKRQRRGAGDDGREGDPRRRRSRDSDIRRRREAGGLGQAHDQRKGAGRWQGRRRGQRREWR